MKTPWFINQYVSNAVKIKVFQTLLFQVDAALVRFGTPRYLTLHDMYRYIQSLQNRIVDKENDALKNALLQWALFYHKLVENLDTISDDKKTIHGYQGIFESESDFAAFCMPEYFPDASDDLLDVIDYEVFQKKVFRHYYSVKLNDQCHIFSY